MPVTARQRKTLSVGETRLIRFDFTDDLDDGASLTGTPTVAEVTTTALTLASKAVNTTTYVDSDTGATVAVGKAVQFTCAGGVAGTTYRVRITVSTDSTPTETLVWDVLISWE